MGAGRSIRSVMVSKFYDCFGKEKIKLANEKVEWRISAYGLAGKNGKIFSGKHCLKNIQKIDIVIR